MRQRRTTLAQGQRTQGHLAAPSLNADDSSLLMVKGWHAFCQGGEGLHLWFGAAVVRLHIVWS